MFRRAAYAAGFVLAVGVEVARLGWYVFRPRGLDAPLTR